jgi:ubiquinone/menaquinone biosynthesis C-methylase UbiE
MNQEEVWNKLYSGNSVSWRGSSQIPVPNSGCALDLGCGNGKTVISLKEAGYHVTGVDFSSVAIDYCRNTFDDATFEVASVCDLPFEDKSFDYITAVHVLEHLNDDQLADAVSEIARVLRPEGYLFVRCFTEKDMRSQKRASSEIFYRFYDENAIIKAFEGFSIVSMDAIEEKTRFGTIRSRVEALMKP